MSPNSFLCDAHRKEATLFCLCESTPLFICPTCLPKHASHETYPIVQFDLFQNIGRNKGELRRRNALSRSCQAFLDRTVEKESAVRSEAKAMMCAATQSYEQWLEGDHLCFESLLLNLREETALLLARGECQLSPITQKLHEVLEALHSVDEQTFAQIPAIETLMYLNMCCQEACSRASKKWQLDYESEVLYALGNSTSQEKETRSQTRENFQLQADLQAKEMLCISLEAEIRTLNKQVRDQTSQLEELRLNLKRAAEIENECKALQTKCNAATQHSTALEKENQELIEQCSAQTSQLTLVKQSIDDFQKSKDQLEAQLRSLQKEHDAMCEQHQAHLEESEKQRIVLEEQVQESTLKQEQASHQLDAVQTECKERCAALEREFTSATQHLFQTLQLREFEAQFQKSQFEVPNRKSLPVVLLPDRSDTEARLPDYSTPASRIALEKFGQYSGQEDEAVLLTLGPVDEENGVYTGQWNLRNEKHGYGTYYSKDGDMYEGQWRNNLKNGKGRFISKNGIVYIGDYMENRKEGFGTYYTRSAEFTGSWRGDQSNGVACWKTIKGDQYFGEFLDGQRNGIGAELLSDGSMYVGSWKAGTKHGHGLMYQSSDETVYFGEFAANARSGTGREFFAAGDVHQRDEGRGKGGVWGNLLILEKLKKVLGSTMNFRTKSLEQ